MEFLRSCASNDRTMLPLIAVHPLGRSLKHGWNGCAVRRHSRTSFFLKTQAPSYARGISEKRDRRGLVGEEGGKLT